MQKTMLVFVMLAMVILSGCDVIQEYKSLKAKNQELEQKVKELEQRVMELEQVSLKVKENDVELDNCLEWARMSREKAIQLNGTKHKDGSYSVPTHLMQSIQSQYKDECEHCFRRYGRK